AELDPDPGDLHGRDANPVRGWDARLRGYRGSGACEGGSSGRVVEPEPPGWVAPDRPSALVDESVMRTAQRDEIVEIGRPAVAPVPDVVGVGPSRVPAAGEPAAAVAVQDLAAEPRRDVPGTSADPDRHPGRFHHPF